MDVMCTSSTESQWQHLLKAYALEEQYLSNREFVKNQCPVEESEASRPSDGPPTIIINSGLSVEKLEKYGKYVKEALKFLKPQEEFPNRKQIIFLLDLASLAVKHESSFIELKSNQVLRQLILLSKPTKLDTEEYLKVTFLKLLNSLLLHRSGVKWMTETNYWVDVYSLILQYQQLYNTQILEQGYTFLTTLLEKAIEENRPFCIELIEFMASPIFLTIQQLKVSKSKSIISYTRQIYNNISPHGICFVEVLERLLERRCTQILNLLLKMKLREACDNIGSISDDQDFTVVVYRIVIMLSFYEISELFDGIKVINHNTLDLSGFRRILGREIQKSNIMVVLEICYYALKYLKNKGIRLPKHMVRDKPADIESELMCLQLIPAVVVIDFLASSNNCYKYDQYPNDLKSVVIHNIGMEVFKECSVGYCRYGYELKEKIFGAALDNIIKSFDVVLKTKEVYSMQSINRIIMFLSCTLEAAYKHFKDVVKKRVISYEEQMVIQRIFDIMVDFMETPNISLDVHLKYLDIPTVMLNFLYTISWSSPIVIKGLRMLKLLIVKQLTPEMSLLIDTIKDSAIGNIGHMLFVKLFSSDWEIRHVALGVVSVVAQMANDSFSSFRVVLIEASLHEIVSTLCLEDGNPLVRAAAFKCLQDIFILKDMDKKLRSEELTDEVLEAILREDDPVAKKEAIKFITVIYWHNRDAEDYKYLLKMYTCLEIAALDDNNYLVQQEALQFWRKVVSKHMIDIGWVDNTFPPMIFSKKIVRLTDREIGRRIFHVLNDLGDTPCLHVIKHFAECNDLAEEVSTLLDDWLMEFYDTYDKYKITDESLRLQEEYYPDISSVPTSCSTSTDDNEDETDEIMDIVDQLFPVVENTEEDMGLICHSNLSEIEQQSLKKKVTPTEFVRLVYAKAKIRNQPKNQYEDVEYQPDY